MAKAMGRPTPLGGVAELLVEAEVVALALPLAEPDVVALAEGDEVPALLVSVADGLGAGLGLTTATNGGTSAGDATLREPMTMTEVTLFAVSHGATADDRLPEAGTTVRLRSIATAP